MERVNYKNQLNNKLHFDLHDVHIWSVSTDISKNQLDELLCILCQNEVDRANRFYFEKDRRQYIVARGVLRNILSYYCGRQPDEHHFVYNDYGKPFLADNDIIRFNVSHSGEKVLYGITKEREIGVDIEYVKTFDNAQEIVDRYFCENEKEKFCNLPNHMKNKAFFNCWTRKEAYIKAHGMGLSMPLNKFEVSFIPGEPVCLLETSHDMTEKDRWTFNDIQIESDYVAAVAVKGHNLLFRKLELHWYDMN